jgi:threonine dehydrogenase-like Zn-dependent dehydrogenase
MHATLIHGDHDIRFEEVPDPVLATGDDAIVRVVAACVCGSDLWPYRGVTKGDGRIGHEFVGVVEQVGASVAKVKVGDFVIAPFYVCDMTCVNCRNGVSTSCLQGSWWGSDDRSGHFADGGQGELIRVPFADGTLAVVPGPVDDALVPHLLTLSDVMGTGHHAAVSAGVQKGDTVVVVGDGAVGLCGVLAASRLGASRIVAMSRHPQR